MHEGFPNEYAVVLCSQCDADGKAIPPAGSILATGVAPDVCSPPPPPPPPVQEVVEVQFYCRSDNTSGQLAALGRLTDQGNYYAAVYSVGSNIFEVYKVVGDIATSLGMHSPFADVPIDDYVDVDLTIVGSTITGHCVHANDEATITVTDTDLTSGVGGGFFNAGQEVNLFNAFLNAVNVAQDNFIDTPGTNLTSHAMDAGSGWYVGTSGSTYQIIDATGTSASPSNCGSDGGSYITSFPVAMTNYP
jgi:hypothetical protein